MSDDEEELQKIQVELSSVDAELQRLNTRRNELLEEKNQIKDKRLVNRLARSQQFVGKDWSEENFEWSKKLRDKMKEVFKLKDFRPQQLKTINAFMSKNDVLLLAPTGGGKSLCFQLPAMVSEGLTLVISPLIALMEDQVWNLKKLGVKAEILCSATDKDVVTAILRMMSGNDKCDIKILYVTPERLAKSKRFMTALQKCYLLKKLDRIAVDEVHCCSTFGHDFRPDYKFLGTLKNMFGDIPILGVTATATAKVIIDVQKMLNIRDCLVFNAPFNRKNLYYHVMEKPSDKTEVCDLLADLLLHRYANKSGIIYTFSIKDTEELTSELLKRDVKVRPYHANLESVERTRVHSKWLNDEIQAVVATVAFGMGIDKSNCRFVIHHTLSKSMENFYQESGRAGRDGDPAECILMYRFQDISKITTMMFTEYTGLKNAYSMISFCINGSNCRRDLISKHFAEVWDGVSCHKMCDRCFYEDKIAAKKIYLANHLNNLCQIIDHADNLDVKLTGLKLIDAWFHKGPSKLRLDIPAPDFDRYYGEQIIAHALIHHYLKEDFHFTAYSANSYIKRGSNSITAGRDIQFQPARVLRLPTKSFVQDSSDDVTFVREGKIKKRRSEISESSSPDKRVSKKKQRKESTVVITSDDNMDDSIDDNQPCSSKKRRTKSENVSFSDSSLPKSSGKSRKSHSSSDRSISKIAVLEEQVKDLMSKENQRRNTEDEKPTTPLYKVEEIQLNVSDDEIIEIKSPMETIEID